MVSGKYIAVTLISMALFTAISCNKLDSYYSADDFENVPKTDGHFHYLTDDTAFIRYAISLNFRLLTPVWDGEEAPVAEQIRVASAIKRIYPGHYAFFGTFRAEKSGEPGFTDYIEESIRKFMDEGASGLKLWKNIGMVQKDSTGKFLMIDDPVFEPMFRFLVREKIPVIAHLGEPRNCWLPLDKMSDPGDASYFKNNPQYHMYLHPEVPSYDEQIQARDNILRKYPDLDFTGAHLGSLEWSVDEVAKRLDSFPEFRVDLAARMFHIQYQSARDYDKVRNFFIKYQDRIIYGTDMEVHNASETNKAEICENLRNGWLNQWLYLVTDSTVNNIRGLHLPVVVIDKIYYKNSERFFNEK